MMFLPQAVRTAADDPYHRFVCRSGIARVLLLCGLMSADVLAQTAPPDDQPRKVSGTVINWVTKAPIPRALVSTSDNRLAMLTDGEGHFELTMPQVNTGVSGTSVFSSVGGAYQGCSSWLEARKPGYLDCIEPETGSRDNDLTIALVPEALIHGRVSVDGSEPLSGTDVQLFYREVADGFPRWMPRHEVRTNSAGEFRFAELPAGEYKLLTRERTDDDPVADAPGRMYGYPPVFYPGAADFASAETIHVSAGQTVEADLVAARQPYYRVNIPVSNSDVSSGLTVTVRSQAGPGYSLGYNPVTKRIEGFLPNGNFIVEGTAFGPNVLSGMVNLKVDGAGGESAAMTLVPGGSITLDVKEHFTDTTWSPSRSWNDGKRKFTVRGPRAYLQARLEAADDSEPMRGASLGPPTDESLVLENVLPGRYWLRLDTAHGYVASARLGDLDLLRQPLVVTSGPSAPIEVELRDDTAEIEGTVTGIGPASADLASRLSRRQTWVYCIPLPDGPGQFNQFIVEEAGQFHDARMAPGAYRIVAFASRQQHLPYRDAEAMKAYEARGPVVHLSAGQKVSVQVPLITDSDAPEK
jgi:hypothetical protein